LEADSGDLGDPLLISIMRSGSERDGLNVDRRAGTYGDAGYVIQVPGTRLGVQTCFSVGTWKEERMLM
jgi:hypothetical protein